LVFARPAFAAPTRSSLAAAVLSKLNAVRAARLLPALRMSPGLTAAAREHSSEMLAHGYFGHDSFDGTVFWRRIRRFYPGRSLGENILWASPGMSPTDAVVSWMASPEHRANILFARWRVIGIGAVHASAAPGYYGGHPVTVITTDFGAP
jgi:uncharacterized protein YkwD